MYEGKFKDAKGAFYKIQVEEHDAIYHIGGGKSKWLGYEI